ncbi:hypothetical protein KY284_032399 [Solanum tuberosum]|nr:hypothetical protein KY284_032399 [Solanum tuberosum]
MQVVYFVVFPLVTQYEVLQKVYGNVRDFHGLIVNGCIKHEMVENVLPLFQLLAEKVGDKINDGDSRLFDVGEDDQTHEDAQLSEVDEDDQTVEVSRLSEQDDDDRGVWVNFHAPRLIPRDICHLPLATRY